MENVAQQTHGLRSESRSANVHDEQQDGGRDILLEALVDAATVAVHQVRVAAVNALANYTDDLAARTLLRFAKRDLTYSVEAAASSGLGNQDATDEIVETLLVNCKKPSWNDQIETAAVAALAQLGDPRGVEAARNLARYGRPYRSRPSGIAALGQLGRDESVRKDVRRVLVKLLYDPQDKSALAAIDALKAMGDEEAIPALEKYAESSAPADRRRRAEEAIKIIRADMQRP